MTPMLPTAYGDAGSLTDVLASCLSAVGVTGLDNKLNVPDSSSLVLLVVDGLGSLNLQQARGHARFMSDSRHARTNIKTVFPSTTAAALTSLMTGADPCEHGIVGYRLRDPDTGVLFNQLNELDQAPSGWMRAPTLARTHGSSAEVVVVGRAKFEHSALSRMIYDGARYVSAETIDARIQKGVELAHTSGRVVLVYVSELDSAAHKHGVESSHWGSALEELDGSIRQACRTLPPEISVVVTADHGIVDVPAARQTVFFDSSLVDGVIGIGGEPRCLQLYVQDKSRVDQVVSRWRAFVGATATVQTRSDALHQGLFGVGEPSNNPVTRRIGDVVVLATSETAFYDGNAASTAPQRMIGQHGALSDAEMDIPFIVIRNSEASMRP